MTHVKKEMLSFFVTTECNLDCSYCYTNKGNHKHQTIDFEFAKLGMDEYFQTNYRKRIRYQGAGEPTCKFGLMKKIRDYAYSIVGDKLSLEIQTNGVFEQSIRDWLCENVDVIWVSFDGLPEMHDQHRREYKTNKPTAKRIEKNVRYLTKNCSGMTGIRTTITSESIHKQIEFLKYFSNLGVEHVWSDPVFPSVGEKDTSSSIDIMEYAKEFIKASDFADEIGIFYGSILTCNFDEETTYHCRACLPMPHLTTDGYVSACDMALFGEDNNHMSVLIYGKWDKKNNKIVYDQNKINMIRSRSADNMLGCKNCIAKYHCAGYCLGEVTNETGNMFGKKVEVCEPIRYLFKNLPANRRKYKYIHP